MIYQAPLVAKLPSLTFVYILYQKFFKFSSRLRRLRQHSQLPIIIATEYSRSHDSPTVVSYGTIIPAFDDWLCHFGGTTSDYYCLLYFTYILYQKFFKSSI